MKQTNSVTFFSNAKTVQVKLLVPYAIIAVVLFAFAGLVTGWQLREEMNSKVSAEASSIANTLKENQ